MFSVPARQSRFSPELFDADFDIVKNERHKIMALNNVSIKKKSDFLWHGKNSWKIIGSPYFRVFEKMLCRTMLENEISAMAIVAWLNRWFNKIV